MCQPQHLYVQFKYNPPSYPVANPNIFYPICNEGT